MRFLLISLVIATGFGCDSDPVTQPASEMMEQAPTTPSTQGTPPGQMEAPTPPQMETPQASAPADPVAAEVESNWGDPAEAALAFPPEIIEPGRVRRRMNLDQLENAFLSVSGGLNWTERQGQVDVSLFRALSATLGKPDYIQSTNEVLEPTALFQKFLDDAARQVCGKMIARDQERPAQSTMMLWDEDEDGIQEHLQALILRFHQRDLGAESADLAQWRWLYDSVVFMTDSRAERWNTVCVALFTHPDFYTY